MHKLRYFIYAFRYTFFLIPKEMGEPEILSKDLSSNFYK